MMNKISFYDASFPCDFGDIPSRLEHETQRNESESIKVVKKRTSYIECIFTYKNIFIEEYLDLNNNLNKLERMKVETIIFRIYKFNTNNFIVFDQPRSILKLRNLLSKIFNFEFSLNKKTLNLDNFIKNNRDAISHIYRIDAREIIHPNNIFEKKILYTQSFDNNLFDFFSEKITTKSYKIFKIDLIFNDMPTVKITISYDFKFIFSKVDHDDFLLFLMKSQNNIESLKLNLN